MVADTEYRKMDITHNTLVRGGFGATDYGISKQIKRHSRYFDSVHIWLRGWSRHSCLLISIRFDAPTVGAGFKPAPTPPWPRIRKDR